MFSKNIWILLILIKLHHQNTCEFAKMEIEEWQKYIPEIKKALNDQGLVMNPVPAMKLTEEFFPGTIFTKNLNFTHNGREFAWKSGTIPTPKGKIWDVIDQEKTPEEALEKIISLQHDFPIEYMKDINVREELNMKMVSRVSLQEVPKQGYITRKNINIRNKRKFFLITEVILCECITIKEETKILAPELFIAFKYEKFKIKKSGWFQKEIMGRHN